MTATKKRSLARKALIKRQLDLVGGIPVTPPRLYIGRDLAMVLRTDPTKYSTGPVQLCRPHGQPLKWCVVCAEWRKCGR